MYIAPTDDRDALTSKICGAKRTPSFYAIGYHWKSRPAPAIPAASRTGEDRP